MENTVQQPQTTAPATQQPPEQQQPAPTAQQTAELANKTAFLASLGSSNARDRVRKVMDEVAKSGGNGQQQQSTPSAQQSAASQQQTQSQTQPAPDDKNIIKTDFGHIEVPVTQKGAPQVKTLEDAFGQMESVFGFKVTKPEELLEKKEVFKQWRTASQKLPEAEKKVANYETALNNLDDDLKVAVKSNLSGGDWKKELEAYSGTKVNLTKPFDQQDPKMLVKALVPKAFSPEELEDIDTSSREFQVAYTAAQTQFGLLKQQREASIAQRENDARAFKKGYDASVSSSMSRLTEVIPGFTDESKKAQLSAALEGLMPLSNALRGTDLGNLLFNEDGTVHTDAAAKLAFAQHGATMMQVMAERMKELGASQAREEIVDRGQRHPSQTSGHTGTNGNNGQQQEDPRRSLLQSIIKGSKQRY